MNKINPILQWWVAPDLPVEHIWIKSEDRPKKLYPLVRVYVKKWLAHPLKRRISKYYLLYLRKFHGLKVVGITGSSGKTTTKDMIETILSSFGSVKASYKNIDPVYNIPTTVLRCKPSTDYLILEMGLEYPGEMDFYLWLASPDVGVITNIFPTHTEFFGSISGVFEEKSKLVKKLKDKDTAVLNIDDNRLCKLEIEAKILWYGKKGKVSFGAIDKYKKGQSVFDVSYNGLKEKVEVSILGDHLIHNALASIAIGISLGLPFKKLCRSLSKYKGTEHRMQVIFHKSGALIVDDSYNNNPEAARATIKTVKDSFSDRKLIVVFGDMLELGRKSGDYHTQLGRYMKKMGVKFLLGVGPLSTQTVEAFASENSIHIEKEDLVDDLLKPHLQKGNVILIKGSRSIFLDRLVSRLAK